MKQIKNILGTTILIAAVVFTACEKDIDTPPIKELPQGNIITIDSLRNIHTSFDTTFTDDYSVFGIITADNVSGNLFKELYIQDETNAIKLDYDDSRDFFIGDKVRVSLKGAILRVDQNMMVLENIFSVVKQEDGLALTPEVVTIADINNLNGALSAYQGKLIQLNNVEFACLSACENWADPIAQSDENRDLIDTIGNTIVVRSSGFSNFAGSRLPFGRGSLIGVVSQFGSTIQLTIRTPEELTMSGTRKTSCATCPIFSKDFEDESVTSGGWSIQLVTGTADWVINDQGAGNTFYAQISNFSGGNTASENWLISPSINLTSISSPQLTFENAANFSGADLEVLISTDYDGVSLPATATWTTVTTPNPLSSGGFVFVASGNINLTSFISANTYVAFKYTGTNSSGKTWEIDNINIFEL